MCQAKMRCVIKINILTTGDAIKLSIEIFRMGDADFLSSWVRAIRIGYGIALAYIQ